MKPYTQKKSKTNKHPFSVNRGVLQSGGGGITIIEMLVGVTLFISVVTIASGIFISSLKNQRQLLATRTILDETSFVMEYMSRAIRMAKKDLSGICMSPKLNYEETRGGKGLEFMNHNDQCQEFFWDDTTNRLKEIKEGNEYFLTSSELVVNSLSFNLIGQSQYDDFQPQVTIFFDLAGPEGTGMKIQTTVSQRNLDIER